MVAVVDPAAQGLVLERAAAAAGLTRRLVHHDSTTATGELDRAGKAGEAGADHVDGAAHAGSTL